MTSRAESAAATRRALLSAAAGLLDEGGPDVVTLRQVGARAGVSRGAPYGHFADKEDLLAELAIERWATAAAEFRALRADASLGDRERLRLALRLTLTLARDRPHLYALMFVAPSHDPERMLEAAAAAQDEFLAIVAGVVGAEAARARGALLMSTTHGIAGMELSGQLAEAKWGTTGERLLDDLLDLLA